MVAVAVVATLAVAFASLGSGEAGPAVGQQAPAFRLDLYGGGTLTSESLRGKVVVLHFWGSWCGPCREEAPTLRRLWEDYAPRGVQFVGVSYKDVEAKALAFLEQYGLGFPNGPDARLELSRAYRVRGVPETYLIGPDGTLVYKYIGPLDEAHFRRTVERLLTSR
ncbi:MAG: TlpA family protein disulfide reductase [Anaerolineae bacterium]